VFFVCGVCDGQTANVGRLVKKRSPRRLSQPTSTHGLHVRASETGARCDTDVTVTAKARAPPTPLGNNCIFLSLCLVVQS
jgi:hypothetical protein